MTSIRIVAALLAFAGMVLWIYWADGHRERWGLALGPAFYCAFELAFWGYVFFGKEYGWFDAVTANQISLAQKYYALFLTIGAAVFLLRRYGRHQPIR
jgi:hypothetical protein